MQTWLNYKAQLGKALTQIYPLRKKQTNPAEPEWVTKRDQWGLNKKYANLAMPTKKNFNATRNHRTQQADKSASDRLRLQPILQAWRQAARYTKEHAKEIQYAHKPIIDMANTRNRSNQGGPEKKTIRAKTDTAEES